VAQETLRGELSTYRIFDVVASGGFGSVAFGRDTATNVPVAVKRLHAHLKEQSGFVERFEREAATVRGLTHPNIVRLLDQGRDDSGVPFLVLEWVEGLTVAGWVKQQGRYSSAQAAEVACQVLEGLEAAWARRVVHRDIKPANIIVTPSGRVKVMDFGIAKDTDLATLAGTTGGVVGTPAYIAPEQLRGEPLDCRADLYALGATLYMMLSGRPPFEGPSLTDYFRQHLEQDPPPLETQAPGVPRGLVAVVEQALAKRPDDRYASPLEMEQALLPFRDESAALTIPAPAPVRPPPPPPQTTPAGTPSATPTGASRFPLRIALPVAGMLVVVGLVAVLYATLGGRPSPGLPTPGPQPTATPEDQLLEDPLTNPVTGRLIKASNQPSIFVVAYTPDGYLVQKVNRDAAFVGVTLPGSYDNAAMAIDARLVDVEANRLVTLICRDNAANHTGYSLSLAPHTGQLSLGRRDGARSDGGTITTALAGPLSVPQIKPGSETNRLELICAGSKISARVNGTQVASVDDSAYRDGELSIGLETEANGPPVKAYFRNLLVTRPR
jgi:serine/threonine-protein kinase